MIGSSAPIEDSKICDAIKQSGEDAFVDGAFVDEVHDEDRLFLLADPIDSTDALLDLHRVPRKVVVDDCRAEFEVETLARYSVGEYEIIFAGAEAGHDLAAPLAINARRA